MTADWKQRPQVADAADAHNMSYAIILLMVGGCLTAPAPVDQPIRVDLPVYDNPTPDAGVKLASPLELENHPADTTKQTKYGGGLSNKLQAAGNIFASASASKTGGFGIFAAPVTTLEGAILETEGFASQKLSAKENLQNTVAGIFQPKPIVDTITEEEKYGNSGDKFYSAGRAVVNGYEGFSNLLNSVLEVPSTILKKISRAASEKLNNLGGRLVGL